MLCLVLFFELGKIALLLLEHTDRLLDPECVELLEGTIEIVVGFYFEGLLLDRIHFKVCDLFLFRKFGNRIRFVKASEKNFLFDFFF